MAKRRSTRRKANNSNSFMIFFIIVIVLAVLSFVITYYVTKTFDSVDKDVVNIQKTEATTEEVTEEVAKESTEKYVLEGTWASYNDGAMLTIRGRSFTIELPSVESTIVASGKIVIVGNTVTFVYTNQDSDCGIKPGKYEFVIESDDEVTFSEIDDTCSSRKIQLIATWFRV